MSLPAIRVTGLGKQYRIGVARHRYATLRESITAAVARPFKRASDATRAAETIWALKRVDTARLQE